MINEVEIQKAVLMSINTPRKAFRKTLCKLSEELREYIEQHNLNHPDKREIIAWHVQGLLEKSIYEHGTYDNYSSSVQLVVEQWNSEQLFKLSYESVEMYFQYLFKSPNMRKAYVELCEGDVQSYKAFANFPDDFMDYVLRAIFANEAVKLSNVEIIQPVAKKVFNTFYKEDSDKEYRNSLERLGVLKKGTPDEESSKQVSIFLEKVISYGRTMRKLDLPIIKGFDHIFKQVIEMDPSVLKAKEYGHFFKQYIRSETIEIALPKVLEIGSEVESISLPNNNLPISSDEEEFILLEDNVPVAVNTNETVVDIGKEPVGATETSVEPSGDDEKKLLAQIDDTIARLQASKELATAIFAEKTATSLQSYNGNLAEYEERFAIAEEEISRLHRTIEEERAKVATIEENSFKKLVDAIAGVRSNYLLSDLYRESLGESNHSREILQGQLMNLFNQFNMAIGLEMFASGHQTGDEFDLTRHELAHSYRILNEVQTQGDQIRVKLMQYGWTINGKIVVQPLIQELKGAY